VVVSVLVRQELYSTSTPKLHFKNILIFTTSREIWDKVCIYQWGEHFMLCTFL